METGGCSATVCIEIKKPKMTIGGNVETNKDSNGEKIYVGFIGIPYGKPPTKEKQFQSPDPYEYDALRDGNPEEMPSDTLYLSVYMPKRPEDIPKLLPVLVYFHDDKFSYGSGSYDFRAPDSILMHDLLFVAVSYRLGPLGFLNMSTPNCRGNAGLKDQVLALKWVRDNIEAFRGNPNNVTICGAGAGGSCVNFHLISPLSRNLFSKAIVMSGGIYCPWGFTGFRRDMMKKYMVYRDRTSKAVQREVVAQQLVEAGAEGIIKSEKSVDGLKVHLGPSIERFPEDAFLPPKFSVDDLLREAKPVPVLAGITAEEGADLLPNVCEDYPMKLAKNDVRFQRFLMASLQWDRKVAKRNLSKIREIYYGDVDMRTLDETTAEICFANLVTDLWFHRFYDNFKLGAKKNPAKFYVYLFNFTSEINASRPYRKNIAGAAHGDDLFYLFCPHYNKKKQMQKMTKKTSQKVKTMCSLWASFCESGIPKSDCHDVEWSPHTDDEPKYLDISNNGLKMRNERLFQKRWDVLNDIIQEESRISPYQNNFHLFSATVKELNDVVERLKSMSSKSPDSIFHSPFKMFRR